MLPGKKEFLGGKGRRNIWRYSQREVNYHRMTEEFIIHKEVILLHLIRRTRNALKKMQLPN